ncbi:molybdenum import ATP-binding protein ModC [Sulfuriferula plumbiphila]|uniref:Molybdenum import ATP-binding protein ModC n=1 Tax=Sulfuriferula plumbiphila TaxID=171865 RepID=A0A512L332_9PROT|nr:molybdenum ABC transporter ATP-binding protein [Sulfuriferula plumbiphila]BBP02590.1 molybdenum import ATP-binding protein ModC [Sulfuriferula plumbiphila]GEP28884.1 molybdenum import ATP-binding protein ModC [Sulfuriferula plumbiphila]
MNTTIGARFKLDYSGFSLDVDLDLPGRGVTALFGHSGSGKTTLLRCIAGLERVADGFLQVNGAVWQDDAKRIYLPTHQRPLGYVFQEASLFPHLNVRRNLEYGMKRVPASERRVSLDQAIELLGIGALLAQKPGTLSGGERQRVGIARALAVSPKILLMDEPLVALDLARKQEILPYLEHLHDELEIPILYVSHAPDEVARLADHIVVMDGGRVLANGPLSETLARLDLPIRLGEDAGVVVDAIVGMRDKKWHLLRADFAGGGLWVRDMGAAMGEPVRIRILARDVSLALARPDNTSILNQLHGKVVALADDTHPSLALIRLQVGDVPLLGRVTKLSADTLGLAPGKSVWVQVKSVALMR